MENFKTEVGMKIQDCVCDDCKEKIRLESASLSKFDLLRPKRVARRFQALLCGRCRLRVLARMRRLGRG